MTTKLLTIIPVYNGERFILQTLESLAKQTRLPDRVVVLDNCSTDNTEPLVRGFKSVACEWIRNPSNLGLFGNCNRGLEFAEQTEYLHFLHADDLIEPKFYETLLPTLEDCHGRGLAFCLDERIDENQQKLSLSGKVTGQIEVFALDRFLREKAEIGNQAFCASLLKTHYQKSPCQFRLDMPILADMVFWPDWGRHCQKLVRVHLPLMKYRWHGTNTTGSLAQDIQTVVLDEWKTMQLVEGFRKDRPSLGRRMKLKGLFGVRSGIKAKRFRERGNAAYAREIIAVAKPISGSGLWLAAQAVVQARDLLVYGLLRRRKHPKNFYS